MNDIDKILNGPGRVKCEPQHANIPKTQCVRLQTKGVTAQGAFPKNKDRRDIPYWCQNCEQGKEVLKEMEEMGGNYVCKVDYCLEPKKARGLCTKHYSDWYNGKLPGFESFWAGIGDAGKVKEVGGHIEMLQAYTERQEEKAMKPKNSDTEIQLRTEITILLTGPVHDRLKSVADAELRTPIAQAQWIVEKELGFRSALFLEGPPSDDDDREGVT